MRAKLPPAQGTRADVLPLPFSGFLDLLKRRGFAVGVDRHLRLVSLLEKIGGECRPEQLKHLIAPLFATNEKEQARFYRVFDEYFALLQPPAGREERGRPAVDGEKQERKPASRMRRVLSRGWVVVLFAAVVIFWTVFFQPRQQPQGPVPPVTVSPTPAPRISPRPFRPIPSVAPTSGPAVPSEAGQSEVVPILSRNRNVLLWIGGLLPAALFAASELRRFSKRRQLVLERTRGRKPPFTWPIRIEPQALGYLNSEQFYKVARKLRRRQIAEYHRLDIPRTIDATIAASGYPTFQYRPDSRMPEYLILIDRSSNRDHQAALFDQFSQALQREGLFVTRFFFDGDPRVCWSERATASLGLSDLQKIFSEHRLIIFGRGERLIDPVTGELTEWSAMFLEWHDRAVVTPVAPSGWNQREQTLTEQFLVFPATLEGIEQLAERFDSSVPTELEASDADDPLPPDLDRDADLGKLRSYLGEPVFQWLCACAIYPELYWDLTLLLGSLPALGEHLVTEKNLLRLVRIPWFRAGAIPDERRLQLLAALDPAKEAAVRAAIVRTLERSPAPDASFAAENRRLEIILQERLLGRRSASELKSALRSVPVDKVRDYVLLHETQRISRLAFALPKQVRLRWSARANRRLTERMMQDRDQPRGLFVLTLICLFCTGLIVTGHFFPAAPFISVPWRGEQSFEDLLRKEGRKTSPPRAFVFLGIDQTTLQLPPFTAKELADNRALQLLSERPFPWSREVWALLLDKLFAAGARVVMFDSMFNPPNDGDPAFHAALDRYRDKVVVGANFDFRAGGQAITPNETLIPPPQLQDNRVGFVNFWPDAIDGKTRAATYRVTNRQLAGLPPEPGDEIYESLAARALGKIGHANDVPDDLRGHMIRFTAPDAFEPRPLYEVFDPKLWRANYADGAFFKDKVVMVGGSAQVLHDIVDTPMSPNTLGPTLQFQAMAAALGHEFLRSTPRKVGLALVCAAGLVAWLLVAFMRKPLVCLGGLVGITAGYLVMARLLYDNTGLLLLTVPVLSALLLSASFSLSFEYFLDRVGKLRFFEKGIPALGLNLGERLALTSAVTAVVLLAIAFLVPGTTPAKPTAVPSETSPPLSPGENEIASQAAQPNAAPAQAETYTSATPSPASSDVQVRIVAPARLTGPDIESAAPVPPAAKAALSGALAAGGFAPRNWALGKGPSDRVTVQHYFPDDGVKAEKIQKALLRIMGKVPVDLRRLDPPKDYRPGHIDIWLPNPAIKLLLDNKPTPTPPPRPRSGATPSRPSGPKK